MSSEHQAVFLNAVPLLALAAVYLAVAVALAPLVWRQRRRVQLLDWGTAAVFPSVGVCALVLGVLVLHDRRPLAGHGWASFAAIVLALVPALPRDRPLEQARGGGRRRRPRARGRGTRDAARPRALGRLDDHEGARPRARRRPAGRVVADEIARMLEVEFVAVALVDTDTGEAEGLVARSEGSDLGWWTASGST